MIQLPTKEQMRKLRSIRQPNSLSIYSAYVSPNSPDNPNRIQLRNLLKEARQHLSESGFDRRKIDSFLEPVDRLIDGKEFRPNFRHSLALFLSNDFFECYRLPTKGVKSSVSLSDKFDLRPISEIQKANTKYYLLSLSHNGVQLFKGDKYEIEQLKFQEFQTDLKTALAIDEYPKGSQYHLVGQTTMGKKAEKFHGQYNKAQVDKDMLVEFFRRVDRGLHRLIRSKTRPLILAGVDYLLPLYRQVNTFPRLLDGQIVGSTEQTSRASLRKQASLIVK